MAKVAVSKVTRTYSASLGRWTYGAAASAVGDVATLDTLIDAGAFMELPVHRGILFGMEAMVKLNQDGISDMPKIIVKPLGSAGSADPLDQRSTVGWKSTTVAKILNDAYAVSIISASSQGANS